MTSSLAISASNADARAFSTDYLESLGIGCTVCFCALYTCAELGDFAFVVDILMIIELDIFDIVHPQT
jgi:hypothetical protein